MSGEEVLLEIEEIESEIGIEGQDRGKETGIVETEIDLAKEKVVGVQLEGLHQMKDAETDQNPLASDSTLPQKKKTSKEPY